MKLLAVVPLDTRIQAARELMAYVYPKLSAQQISGQVDVIDTQVPTEQILRDPKLSAALAELAMMVANGEEEPEDGCLQLPSGIIDATIGD